VVLEDGSRDARRLFLRRAPPPAALRTRLWNCSDGDKSRFYLGKAVLTASRRC